jgi:hypothetical protein
MEQATISLLNQRVDLLKKDIQEIIDTIKLEKDSEKKSKLQERKSVYLEELDTTLSQIKQIQKEEKQKLNRENEIKRIIRTNDSMKYHSVKNKSNSIQLMQEQKDNREKAKEIFEKKSQLKQEYLDLEKEFKCEEYPAFLFFDRNIIDKYKLCPFIELNKSTLEDRKKWLSETFDKGELYFNLYNKLINKETLNILLSSKEDIEKYFEEIHSTLDAVCVSGQGTLDDINKKSLDKIHEYLKEYKVASVKTKKLKEKFNIIINNTSTIVKNTNLKVNEYLSLYYDIVIPINNIVDGTLKKTKENIINEMEINSFGVNRLYDQHLEDYLKVKNDIENANKFVFNTVNNLNQELYDYLYNKSIEKKSIRQQGKYFKKWSELSKEEKIDRFESYAEYFPKKYLLEPGVITDNEQINILINELKILITSEDGFERIKYKNLKWNVTGGIIENISCLKYDDKTHKFFLTIEKEIIKNINTTKKASSIRTILNKDTNKIINEELMKHLIVAKKQKKLKEENIKDLKDKFLDKIKEKLKLKRIMLNDRSEINKKFDEIYNLIIYSEYFESN